MSIINSISILVIIAITIISFYYVVYLIKSKIKEIDRKKQAEDKARIMEDAIKKQPELIAAVINSYPNVIIRGGEFIAKKEKECAEALAKFKDKNPYFMYLDKGKMNICFTFYDTALYKAQRDLDANSKISQQPFDCGTSPELEINNRLSELQKVFFSNVNNLYTASISSEDKIKDALIYITECSEEERNGEDVERFLRDELRNYQDLIDKFLKVYYCSFCNGRGYTVEVRHEPDGTYWAPGGTSGSLEEGYRTIEEKIDCPHCKSKGKNLMAV